MMASMWGALLLVGLAACSFDPGFDSGDGGTGSGSDSGSGSNGSDGGGSNTGDGGIDAPGCMWSYMPTNFDPCMLPAPVSLSSNGGTLDTNSTSLPKKVITQSDGSVITVIHLSQFTLNGFTTLNVVGNPVVFAVDGNVDINGTIVSSGGNDAMAYCESVRGTNGADSQNSSSGGGGGGGAAAAENGGSGGGGDGSQAGGGGARGNKVTSTLSPLRAGCRGGNGGRHNASGQAASGGRGGGGVQISTNAKITVRGMIDAAGRGGGGGPAQQTGGAGGGSGGAIFLEGPMIDFNLASRLCADGGSGGEGGGATVDGNAGTTSPCTSIDPARTPGTTNSAGGDGGDGGYRFATSGAGGQMAVTSGGGGGGGGGGVGWIRVKSPNVNNGGAVITPGATN